MSKRRLERAPPVTHQLVLGDFDLFDSRSGVEVTVHASELVGCFGQLARANGFKLHDLLVNSGVSSTVKPLECRVVTRLPKPKGSGWSFDDSGYIALKLKQSSTVRGHTFLGSADDQDDNFEMRLSRSSRDSSRSLHDFGQCSSPPRKRRSVGSPTWLSGFSLSPGTPSCERAGESQPLPIRLHRAAALALSTDPHADSRLVVRHICGHKRCAVAAHFRFGTEVDNKRDEEHHCVHPGCSRQVLPCLQ